MAPKTVYIIILVGLNVAFEDLVVPGKAWEGKFIRKLVKFEQICFIKRKS